MLSEKPEDLRFSSLTAAGVTPLLRTSYLVSGQLCVLIFQLEKPFKYLKLSGNLFEPLISKYKLLIRSIPGSINLI